MPFVSLTRVHLRSFRHLPRFAVDAWRSRRQAARAPGFLGGALLSEPPLGFWTVTVWDDRAAMQAYRNSGGHKAAMPHLKTICDEASVAHWEQDDATVPGPDEARRCMGAEGRLSRLHHPSAIHADKRIPTVDRLEPGPRIRPTTSVTRN